MILYSGFGPYLTQPSESSRTACHAFRYCQLHSADGTVRSEIKISGYGYEITPTDIFDRNRKIIDQYIRRKLVHRRMLDSEGTLLWSREFE
ncbi:MAG: hypothetical protein OEZ34_09300 [Spirochaetia bacterium]|nr:hypothetical protein [Spirochaetia bacterium]